MESECLDESVHKYYIPTDPNATVSLLQDVLSEADPQNTVVMMTSLHHCSVRWSLSTHQLRCGLPVAIDYAWESVRRNGKRFSDHSVRLEARVVLSDTSRIIDW